MPLIISAKDLEMTKYDSHSDRYTDPATGVLKNKLGIMDAAMLDKSPALFHRFVVVGVCVAFILELRFFYRKTDYYEVSLFL
jgi:hypothetical protein